MTTRRSASSVRAGVVHGGMQADDPAVATAGASDWGRFVRSVFGVELFELSPRRFLVSLDASSYSSLPLLVGCRKTEESGHEFVRS
jgi:hypothetical protein